VVQYLVKEPHAYLETKDSDGHTSLVQAVNYSAPRDVIQCLVEAKANLEAKDKSGNTALSLSCSVEGDNFEVVKYLVKEAHACLETRNKDDRTPLMNALFHECHTIAIDVIQCLLEAKANLEATDNWGNTALNLALRAGNTNVVRYLVKEAHANVETKNDDAETPLELAVRKASDREHLYIHLDIVQILLEAKANPEVEVYDGGDGGTILTMAAKDTDFEVVQCLLEAKANLEAKSKSGHTALSKAAYYNESEMVQYLVNARANLKTKSVNGLTPLMNASLAGKKWNLLCLLGAKADPEAKSCNFMTARDGAIQEGHSELAELLRQEKIRLDLRCEEVEQCCARRIRDAIRKHLPRLAMLHSEVMKAVFPLPRDILKLG